MQEPNEPKPLVGTLLRRVIERRLTTGDQIAEICGVSPSTVYRWTRGQSEPDFEQVTRLVRRVTVPAIRKELVSLFVTGLPLELRWDDATAGPGERSVPNDADAMDLCLLTLSCLTQVMLNQRRAIQERSFTDDAKADVQRLMDVASEYLVAARRHIDAQPAVRRPARPVKR